MSGTDLCVDRENVLPILLRGVCMSTTEDYSQRFPHLSFRTWSTGHCVSHAGFGCYRVNTHNPEHERALLKALRSGINCVDTSANYGDGSAEELVGTVVEQLAQHHGIDRSELVLVTKAGYIQGMNYHRAHKNEHLGHAYPQVVKFGEGLWHCLHPEFLEDQLQRSLKHMRTSYLDVFLLHNPEYFLIHADREGRELEDARTEFYDRIHTAFEYCEKQVASGRIQAYGISSNCFGHAARDYDFVSLEKCIEIAKEIASDLHHFQVIQMPLNLLETGAVTEYNNCANSQSVLECAKNNSIEVMVNRVLNAITQNSLIRLAEHAFAGTPAPTESDIAAALGDLIAHENIMLNDILPTLPFEEHSRETLADFLTPAAHLIEHWMSFDSIEHWHEVEVQYLKPRMNEAIEAIHHHPTPGMDSWIADFKTKTRQVFTLITHHYAVMSHPRLLRIQSKAVEMLGNEYASLSISQLAFSAARATDGVSCALIGARRETYVDEVIESLSLQLPSLNAEQWSAMQGMAELVS